MCTLVMNEERNGIELFFKAIPAAAVRESMKAAGFRWHNVKKCWYAKQTAAALAVAQGLADGQEVSTAVPAVKKAAKAAQLAPLWERCKTDSIPEHDKHQSTKEIAQQTRQHIKSRFPEIKFSCTIGRGGWASHNEILFYIKSAPFSKDSQYMDAILTYVKKWLWSFNYDNSDSMTDYFDRGFYETVKAEYNFIEEAPTAEQAADLTKFDRAEAAAEEAKRAEEEAQYKKYLEEMEAAKAAAAVREAQAKKDHENIISHVKVVELPENDKYIIEGAMLCGCGKENNISDVREYGRESANEGALIKRELYFTDENIYNKFCKMFMYDFDFLSECGGTGTFDNRVTDENIRQLSSKQREEVRWYLWDCVAVYFNNELRLIIDPEGYTYARYVNIVEEYTTRPAYEVEQAEEAAENNSFYMPLPVEEQAAALEVGTACTLIYNDPWLLSASMRHVIITAVKICDYAQYKNSLYIEYTEPGRRKAKGLYIHNNSSALIFAGHLPQVPADFLSTRINDNLEMLNFCGAGSDDFIVKCAKYYNKAGYTQIINTLQY